MNPKPSEWIDGTIASSHSLILEAQQALETCGNSSGSIARHREASAWVDGSMNEWMHARMVRRNNDIHSETGHGEAGASGRLMQRITVYLDF